VRHDAPAIIWSATLLPRVFRRTSPRTKPCRRCATAFALKHLESIPSIGPRRRYPTPCLRPSLARMVILESIRMARLTPVGRTLLWRAKVPECEPGGQASLRTAEARRIRGADSIEQAVPCVDGPGPALRRQPVRRATRRTRGSGVMSAHVARTQSRSASNEQAIVRRSPARTLRYQASSPWVAPKGS
jgi:hypothetical protein